jgi:D-beta-D-heptose 7-phosphate kinase/D-beta-D-heptose 1-phosphate adenosyltransferase
LRQQLSVAGIPADGLVEDARRPTTEKVRIVTDRNQQVARVDYECDADICGGVEHAVIDQIARHGRDARALLVSDYLKGAITRPLVEALFGLRLSAGPPPLVVDPKIPHLAYYRGATLVTPNHHEAEAATHRRIRTDEEARDAAHVFRKRVECEAVLITRGEQGMWLSDRDGDGAVPAVTREVSDVTGAGDTVVATLSLALAAGATLAEAAVLANHAAGIVVGKFGPATLTREELLSSFPTTR